MTVRPGEGVNGSDRVVLLFFPEDAVKNGWLEVRVLANSRTGLSAPDVFYFGNLIGESGDGATPLRVGALDLAAVKRGLNTTAGVESPFDFNRDGRVNALDLALARQNLNRRLTPPPVAASFAARVEPEEAATDLLK